MAPEWHLGIWHKKDSSSQTALHFASKPHPIPAQPGHFPPSLETGNPDLTTEGRGPQERGSPTQGAEELEHTDTQRPRKHTHTKATCTHSYTNAQALPGARLRRRPGLRSGSPISWNPDSFLFGNIRGRGAPCPLASRQQVSTRAEGADPGHTGARSAWRSPSSLAARTLRHLQVNVQFLLFRCPHTHRFTLWLAGHFHSTNGARYPFPWSVQELRLSLRYQRSLCSPLGTDHGTRIWQMETFP